MANTAYYENSLKRLMDDPSSFANDPAFKFQMDMGTQAVQRSQRGMRGSGNALAALQQYGQGLAHQTRGAELDRLGKMIGQEQSFDLGERADALGNRRLDVDAELGRGQLALGRGRLDLDRTQGDARLGLDRDRMGLERELGLGRLSNERYGIDTGAATTRRGQDFEFDLGSQRNNTERDLGLGRIAADRERNWWDYDINQGRNSLADAEQRNRFNIDSRRLDIDRYNAGTNRMGTRANAEYQRGRNRREEIPFRDPWSVY